MKKRKKIIDQVYNGAFENLDFDKGTKNTFLGCAFIILVGIAINQTANARIRK